ncbi:MAG: phosphatidylglycerol lysyltransferase domain-containing protein [Methanosarcina barkeri]|nr:phosphatidylglycerol lysyltransferase domain-containing protein [Methanosarcina sp. ERenArc_MAG2]
MSHFPVALVRNETEIVAFANLWTSTDNEEISVDLMRHSPDAPDRTMEYLFVKLMLWGKEKGYRRFSSEWLPSQGLKRGSLPLYGIK